MCNPAIRFGNLGALEAYPTLLALTHTHIICLMPHCKAINMIRMRTSAQSWRLLFFSLRLRTSQTPVSQSWDCLVHRFSILWVFPRCLRLLGCAFSIHAFSISALSNSGLQEAWAYPSCQLGRVYLAHWLHPGHQQTMHVFGSWEEDRVPKEKTYMGGTCKRHIERSHPRFKRGTFFLWGISAKHYTVVQPACAFFNEILNDFKIPMWPIEKHWHLKWWF